MNNLMQKLHLPLTPRKNLSFTAFLYSLMDTLFLLVRFAFVYANSIINLDSLVIILKYFQELRGYMLKHGGRFENYFSRKRVTHIICSNLPNSKLKNLRSKLSSLTLFCSILGLKKIKIQMVVIIGDNCYRSFSRGLPVVKPTWVLDCLAADKLLSCKLY